MAKFYLPNKYSYDKHGFSHPDKNDSPKRKPPHNIHKVNELMETIGLKRTGRVTVRKVQHGIRTETFSRQGCQK